MTEDLVDSGDVAELIADVMAEVTALWAELTAPWTVEVPELTAEVMAVWELVIEDCSEVPRLVTDDWTAV